MTAAARSALHVVSAGAAQSVVEQVAASTTACGEPAPVLSFGAVGAQKQALLEGRPCDLVVLTAAMIDELIASGHVVRGSRCDLGAVGGGIAVRAGRPHPDVSTPAALTQSLCAAAAIHLPDPAIATAGRQFVQMAHALGIAGTVAPKLRPFPNGFTAMTHLAEQGSDADLGYTQMTEILFVHGVEAVAPLPPGLLTPTVYALGICAQAADRGAARAFAERLTGPAAQPMLAAAGFLS